MKAEAAIREIIDRETRAWNKQADVSLRLTVFHPDMVWARPATYTSIGGDKCCACNTRSSSASSTRMWPRRRGCSGNRRPRRSAVWDALPVSGLARHGIYSGSEVYLILPALVTVPREHATTIVGAGDVGFLTVDKGSGYGIEEGYSEVCWFYDLDATPSMPEGPIAVNVFARLHDADAFLAVCRRMRLEGAKRLEIAREQPAYRHGHPLT